MVIGNEKIDFLLLFVFNEMLKTMKNRWNIARQLRTVLTETFNFRDREGMEIGLPTFGKFRKQEK